MKKPVADFFCRFVVTFALIFSLAGCTTMRGVNEHVHLDPTDKNTLYRDSWVQRTPPEVHVQPKSPAPTDLKVLFIPFRVTQAMEHPGILGYSTARTVWQTWLTMQLFPVLEFSGDDTPYRRDRAVQLARKRGMDMVVGGFVTYAYAGGTAGGSQLALQVEAHDVSTGQLVWSMVQSGSVPGPQTTDYFIFATTTRMPSDPIHAIAQAIAGDMGKQIQLWTAGPTAPLTRPQEWDKGAHDTLFSPQDPVPGPRTAHDAEPDEDPSTAPKALPREAF